MVSLRLSANIFMCSIENKYFKAFPHGLMLVCYKWYVYDIFVSSLNHVEKLKVYLLSKHSDI